MNNFFVIVLVLFSFLLLFGCTSDTISSPPTTARQIIQKTTCLDTPADWNSYLSGDFNNLYLYVDFNRLCFRSVPDFNISGADINWGQIINFPSGCGVNQAVKIVGSSLVCVDLPVDTNCALIGSCANVIYGNYVNSLDINTSGKINSNNILGNDSILWDEANDEPALTWVDEKRLHSDWYVSNEMTFERGLTSQGIVEIYSVEAVTNGRFFNSSNWVFGSGWSFDSTNFEADHVSNGVGYLTSDFNFVAGNFYSVGFTVKNRTTGIVNAYNGTQDILGSVANNQSYKATFFATQSGQLRFLASNTARLSIDDVTVKKGYSLDLFNSSDIKFKSNNYDSSYDIGGLRISESDFNNNSKFYVSILKDNALTDVLQVVPSDGFAMGLGITPFTNNGGVGSFFTIGFDNPDFGHNSGLVLYNPNPDEGGGMLEIIGARECDDSRLGQWNTRYIDECNAEMLFEIMKEGNLANAWALNGNTLVTTFGGDVVVGRTTIKVDGNLLMKSVDNNVWNCGVSNSGVFSCS